MPTITVNEIEMYYETTGSPDAPPLLLITGLAGYADDWFAQVPALQDDFYVITFDNRGAGRSSQPGPGYTMIDMANDTAALLDALHVPQTFVFGVSMGGMIALNLAVHHPQKVQKLALGCTMAGGLAAVVPDQKVLFALTAPYAGTTTSSAIGSTLAVIGVWPYSSPSIHTLCGGSASSVISRPCR